MSEEAILKQIERNNQAAMSAMNSKVRAARNHLQMMLANRAAIEARCGVYRCTVCLENFVNPEDGQDTCEVCIRRSGNIFV